MSYTFGAAASNNINWSGPVLVSADNSVIATGGWFYPTTLTATRRYWSAGSVFGAAIDGTTSEIRMKTDNATDGEWVTTGAGIVTNKWQFICWLNTCENTGPAAAWRVWVGDAENPPVEITVTNAVAPIGNFVGANSYVVGNNGAATLSFQGDIGAFHDFSCGATNGVRPFRLAASGAITQAEADIFLQRFVIKLWEGSLSLSDIDIGISVFSNGFETVSLNAQLGSSTTIQVYRFYGAAPALITAFTSGVVRSENQPPRRLTHPDWILRPQFLRR